MVNQPSRREGYKLAIAKTDFWAKIRTFGPKKNTHFYTLTMF